MYYWISNNTEYIKSFAAQTAVMIINKSQFENLFAPFPTIIEQRQIAAILTSVDDQIDTNQAKLTSLTRLKTGLMQQLLTGKIRVKV